MMINQDELNLYVRNTTALSMIENLESEIKGIKLELEALKKFIIIGQRELEKKENDDENKKRR